MAKTMSPTEMTAPTDSSRAHLRATVNPRGQELPERRLGTLLRLVHRADEQHAPLEQERDAIPDVEGGVDVVGHDDRGHLETLLHAADERVDGAGGHRV